jgi:hypothetical protein
MSDGPTTLAIVTVFARESVVSVAPSERVTFGRDPATDLVFPEGTRLSRLAGEIRNVGTGVLIVNHSASHSIFVHSAAGPIRLPPATDSTQPAGTFVANGIAHVTVPHWEESGCKLTVRAPQINDSSPRAEPARRTATGHILELNPETKEFVTALMLCKPRLDGGTAPVPNVPTLTRKILEATNSWHLLARFESDQETRAKLTSRTHEHLRQLRVKLHAKGLVDGGESIAPHALAELLISNDIVVPRHLALLDDENWQAKQADLWWT